MKCRLTLVVTSDGGAALEVSCSFCGEQVGHSGSGDDALHLLICHAILVCQCCMVLIALECRSRKLLPSFEFLWLSGSEKEREREKKKEEMGRSIKETLYCIRARFILLNHRRERPKAGCWFVPTPQKARPLGPVS